VGDARRMAHNPEVEGSNPSPATKMQVRGPFSNRERAFCMLFANGFANEGGSGGLVACCQGTGCAIESVMRCYRCSMLATLDP
jgi:hypothetical protein